MKWNDRNDYNLQGLRNVKISKALIVMKRLALVKERLMLPKLISGPTL